MKLILNTKDRESHTTSTNPTWHLEEPIHDYHYLKLSQVILPNVLYSFNSVNNFITLNGVTGYMPANKRYSTMAAAVTALNTNKPSVTNVSSFAFSFLAEEGVLRVTYTSSVDIVFQKNVRLGLLNTTTLPLGTNKTFDLPGIFSLFNSNVIYCCINNFATDDCRTSLGYGTILGCVPVSGAFGDLATYSNDDESSYIEIQGTDTISSVSLTFRDGNGDIIESKNEQIVVEMLLKK